jgi:hypothetical protein
MFWGVAQIVGYREAKRLLPGGSTPPSPLLGMAVGCVSLGLVLALVVVLFYEFSHDHPSYSLLTGGASALFLVIEQL